MTEPLVVPARFNGPPHSGNGGWACGALAARVPLVDGRVVQVRLSAPPPLDVPLAVAPGDSGTIASHGGRQVARASSVVSPFIDDAPAPVGWDDARAAEAGYRGAVDHPFPTCFSCGTKRPTSDGLGLRPGPLPGRPGLTACTWTPDASVADAADEQHVSAQVTWAALDCAGGWSVDLAGRPMVLGTMTARLDALPVVGDPHVIMGRVLLQEGRKAWTETALYALGSDVERDGDADGDTTGDTTGARLVGRAAAVWIAVDPSGVAPV